MLHFHRKASTQQIHQWAKLLLANQNPLFRLFIQFELSLKSDSFVAVFFRHVFTYENESVGMIPVAWLGYWRWGWGPWVLLGSARATAVHGCREALMSCVMGVLRDAGMEGWREERGAETRSLPCAALSAELCCSGCGRRLMWSHLLHAHCTSDTITQTHTNISNNHEGVFFLFGFVDFFYILQTRKWHLNRNKRVLGLVHVQEEAWGIKEADSYSDLIPFDISWLGECGGTPYFMGLAWII